MSETWSSRSLGSRLKHKIFYVLIAFPGPWAAFLLLYPVVFYYSIKLLLMNGQRLAYLRRRFPDKKHWQLWLDSYRLNLAFGRVLLDRAIFGLKGRQVIEDPKEGRKVIDALLEEGRGLLVVSAHVGSWQTGLAWLGESRVPVKMVMLRQESDVDRHYFEHNSGLMAPSIIDLAYPAMAMAAAASALMAGEIVVMMADRHKSGEAVIEVPFLGGYIKLPKGPFYLSARLGLPMVVVFTCRKGFMTVSGEIYRVIKPPVSTSLESINSLATDFAQALSEFVSMYPYQFFNFHDLWS